MTAKSSKKLVVSKDWCKGCGICVELCPKGVLTLENGVINVEDEELCIKCGLCELRCPDYAIYIKKEEDDEI
ncbi:MAG: indolepyruvate ferredoxin oxidoreductase subunit alpha [Senegalia sp. (in: firmicutes)]|uniref:indolepyruvate ferredoxin oxidoreductase subunit alpha n=1 Tax=Senegalia sp. (in: firmicutes) TaxID=1924098 RepID=UPI003F9B199F